MSTLQASKLFILGFDGHELSTTTRTFFGKNELGGVILFKKNIAALEQVVDLNSSLINATLAHPPLIAVDQEGGRVARLRGICTDVPPMAQLTAHCQQDEQLAFRIGAMQGRELVSLGFNTNFSPVCDVASNPDSEVIGDRSFSSDASVVAKLSAQIIRGLQASGVAACAKHFPGHGATSLDSHLILPSVDTTTDLLESRELVPFEHAIAADVACIMSAHMVIKSLDASKPATLSPIIMNDLLRVKMGFRDVIISDDLDMLAIADHYSLRQILELGLRASVDLFIIGNDFDKGLEAINIMQNLINGDAELARLASESINRIDRMKKRYIGTPLAPSIAEAKKTVRSTPHLDLIARCL